MKLIFHIPREMLITTYRKVKSLLHGSDAVIFRSMAAVNNTFVPPSDPSEIKQKHAEIERILNFPDALMGRTTAFRLMEEIGREVKTKGGVLGLSATTLIDSIMFQTAQGVRIRLTEELRWAAEWDVMVHEGTTADQGTVTLDIYDKNWGEVVPTYVIQCVNSGILLYQNGMTAVALALLSIAVEATLRDVLITKGYKFDRAASAVDVYEHVEALVSVAGGNYTVAFSQPMPKSPADLLTTIVPNTEQSIRIKRVINPRDKKVFLKITAPEWFVDNWSSNTVSIPAQKRVNGLGEAFDIARNREGFLVPTMLPKDFDDVICTVRNNLIHLSGDALATPLRMYDATGAFTLGHFIERPLMVYDLVTNVPRFINEQYTELRAAEHTPDVEIEPSP